MKYKYNGQWYDVTLKALDSMVIGSIIQFVGTTIPTGWLECDGSTITQSAYPELYSLIGGTLPDFRGRVLVGQDTNDTDFDTIGETGGSKYLQEHTHTLSRAYQQTGFNTPYMSTTEGWGLPDATGTGAVINNINPAGTGHSGNLQPYAVVKHIIKATNTTPTMASIVNTTNSSTTDTYSCNYINNNIGEIIWMNNTGGGTFAGKNIDASLSEYSKFKIYYYVDTNMSRILSTTGNKGDNISCTYSTSYRRTILLSDTRITIGDGYYVNDMNNNAIIPAYIIGYK